MLSQIPLLKTHAKETIKNTDKDLYTAFSTLVKRMKNGLNVPQRMINIL